MEQEIRILFIIRTLLRSGAERMLVNMANELVKNEKIRVAIYTVTGENEFVDELDSRILVDGGEVDFDLSIYKKDKINNKRYRKFVDDFHPDIIHAHLHYGDILMHSYYYPTAKYFMHIQNSEMDEHNGINLENYSKLIAWTNLYEHRWLIKRYKKFGTSFIACSEGAKKLHHDKIKVGKILLLPNATPINNQLFTKAIHSKKVRMIWVGRFMEVKRPKLMIHIAKILKDKDFSFQLKMVGVGILEKECLQLIQKSNLEQEVQLTGLISNMNSIYENADILVHTSIFEGLPLVFVEAMSNGIPVITSDCMPQNEIIEDGKNGKIITSAQPEDFAESIIEITKNSQVYEQLSKNAITTSKKFGMDKYVMGLIKFYLS